MFILTERTPNPDAMKFVPDAPLTGGARRMFTRESFDRAQSPLAARLFAFADVAAVYVASDFVTVTRSATGQTWGAMRGALIMAIADHLESDLPALLETLSTPESDVPGEAIEAEIQSVLALWIRPGVAHDGGDILFDRFDPTTGTLWIRMHGACGGCPSSRLTLKAGVERTVRRYVPEVLCVEEAASEAAPASPSRLKTWIAGLSSHAGRPKRPVFTYGGRPMTQDLDERRPASATPAA